MPRARCRGGSRARAPRGAPGPCPRSRGAATRRSRAPAATRAARAGRAPRAESSSHALPPPSLSAAAGRATLSRMASPAKSHRSIDRDLLEMLACPDTRQRLAEAGADVLERVNARVRAKQAKNVGGKPVE